MTKTITQKAEIVVADLNTATLTMLYQIEPENIDKQTANKLILSAQRKAKTFKWAYFNRYGAESHLKQLEEFHHSELFTEIEKAHSSFGDALEVFAAKVGCRFIDASDLILNGDVIR